MIIEDKKSQPTYPAYQMNQDVDDPFQTKRSQTLTHVLYNMVFVNSHLQDGGQYHGDICPENIFSCEKGNFKIGYRSGQEQMAERNQLNKLFAKKPLYVSPIIYDSLYKKQIKNIRHDKNKSDIFSLGLCLLEYGLLKSV